MPLPLQPYHRKYSHHFYQYWNFCGTKQTTFDIVDNRYLHIDLTILKKIF